MAGYPLPPVAPDGGWKNDAQWIGNVEYWSEEMMKLGYDLDTIKGIYTKHIGDPFPKNLANSILAKNWLFPGADMLYTYDLASGKKKLNQYTSNEGTKGPGDWVDMDPSEKAAVNQYYGWRNDPAHEWMIKATINSSGPEGNPYQAWLAQWGDKYKDPNFELSMTPGNKQFQATDIHGRAGFDPSGRPKVTAPTKPTWNNDPANPNTTPLVPGTRPGETTPFGSSAPTAVDKSFGNPVNPNDLNYARLGTSLSTSGNSLGEAFGSKMIAPNTNFARSVPGTMDGGWGNMGNPTTRKRFAL